MHQIVVCVGSSCHLKGAEQVIAAVQQFLAEHQLDSAVSLEGAFCQNQCTRGVYMTIDGRPFLGVSPVSVPEILRREMGGLKRG